MRRDLERQSVWVQWTILVLCLLMLGPWGCGRKAPPVPPKQLPLPQPMDLSGSREGDTVRLSWRPGEITRGIARYAVMRSQWPPDAPPCEGCPLVFQEVGRVDVQPETDRYTFTDNIQSDLVYSYRIEPIGRAGDRGPASKRIVIPPAMK